MINLNTRKLADQFDELIVLIEQLPLDKRYKEFLLKGARALPPEDIKRVLEQLKSLGKSDE